MALTRRFLLAALSAAVLASASAVVAQSSIGARAARPVSLPDMALGPANAPITIVEYASMTCPHCADFAQNVLPMLRSKYIDAGKVHFVFREFPLEIKAVGASMLARCIGDGDVSRYFGAVEMLFKRQDGLIERTTDTLKAVGDKFGMDETAVEHCIKDQALLDKLTADIKFAFEELKVDATPTFFVNGERIKGAMPFEELDRKLSAVLKR